MGQVYFDYSVFNRFGGKKPDDKAHIIRTRTEVNKDGSGKKTYDKQTKTAEEIRACLLFWTPQRHVKGKNGKVICSSHDGEVPSLRIDEPLCRRVSAEDLVKVIGQWKGFDQTKVDVKVMELTEGTGKLQVCGIPTKDDNFIRLCPFSKKDPVVGTPPACKESILLKGWDMDNELEFSMTLSGRSIRHDRKDSEQKFTSPFFAFLQQARSSNKAIYEFLVTLKPAENGDFWYLDVADIMPIMAKDMLEAMAERAKAAKESANFAANYVSKQQQEARAAKKRADIFEEEP